MIANISHTSQCSPLILYNEKKVEKGEAERIFYNGMDGNIDKKHVISDFTLATEMSKRIDNYVHISLNFTPEDLSKLDDNSLIEIAHKYLSEMGFPDKQLKIIYRHYDTLHPHIHIVIPKFVDGKVLTTTSNYKKSMMVTRDLEKRYNLTPVQTKEKGEEYSLDKIDRFINQEDISDIEKVKAFNSFFKFFNQQHKPTSLSEYKTQLLRFGVEVIEKTRDDTTIGLLYKRTNNIEKPIKASLIYNSVPLKKMDKSFKNNIKSRDLRYKKIVNHFNGIQRKYDIISYEDIKQEFSKINIEVEFISKGSVINAYRFYDKEQNVYYKPSSIDRKIAFSSISSKIGLKSEKNKKQQNNSILFYLEKQYNLEHKSDSDSMTYLMYMAEHGMIPIVRNDQVFLTHISIKSPEDKDYSRPVKIDLSKVDFQRISNFVNHKDYKKYVYNLLSPKSNSSVPRRRSGNTKNGPLFQVIDLLFNLGSSALKGRTPKLKLKRM